MLIWTIIVLRFVLPLLMFYSPILGGWSNYLLDNIDGDLLVPLGLSKYDYQSFDKLADFFSYLVMLIVGQKWQIKKTVLALFTFRAIGQVLFLNTREDMFLFVFQNFLEPLFLIYSLLVFKLKSESFAYTTYKKHRILIWTSIFIYKFLNEWYLHYAHIDISQLLFGF